jgi:hypothetical protein
MLWRVRVLHGGDGYAADAREHNVAQMSQCDTGKLVRSRGMTSLPAPHARYLLKLRNLRQCSRWCMSNPVSRVFT